MMQSTGAASEKLPDPISVVSCAYSSLRGELRDLLGRAGIASNPGWCDSEILTGLNTVLRTEFSGAALAALKGGDQCDGPMAGYEAFRRDIVALLSRRVARVGDGDAAAVAYALLKRLNDEELVCVASNLVRR